MKAVCLVCSLGFMPRMRFVQIFFHALEVHTALVSDVVQICMGNANILLVEEEEPEGTLQGEHCIVIAHTSSYSYNYYYSLTLS